MRSYAAILALPLFAACSSTSPGTAPGTMAIQGGVNHAAFTAVTAIAQRPSPTSYGIVVLDHPVVCPFVDTHEPFTVYAPNVMALEILVGMPLQAPGPGTYTVGATSGVSVITHMRRNDATCADDFTHIDTRAQAGSVTIDSVTASSISGTVSFQFINGGALEGRFDAPFCDPDAGAGDAGAPSCG